MRISVIVPVLNEANLIVKTLSALQPLRQAGHEVIVVDGGSHDATLSLSKPYTDRLIRSSRGRSLQMNDGAKSANNEILLFLHADTLLPEGVDRFIIEGMEKEKRSWGRFDVKLSGTGPFFRIIEFLMNWRSRLSHIATGDQAIFVETDLFQSVGGFPEIDLMEDIALCKVLKNHSRPLCLRQRVLTSSRRWEEKGFPRTILLMWFLRLAYFLKTDPKRLARFYYPKQP